MDDFRHWAEKHNHITDYAFTQFLLGNRTFAECAKDAVERLIDLAGANTGVIVEGVEKAIESLTDENGDTENEDAVQQLEGVLELLRDPFAGDPTPAKPAFPPGAHGVLPDHEITALARAGMIEPFEPGQVSKRDGQRVISYGVSSYGYDARVSDEFKVFTNTYGAVVDPKNFDDRGFVDVRARDGYVIVPPNSFVLGRTVERFRIPRDVLVVCVGKSTYARTGLVVNITPLEPEWTGHVTLEFSNTTPLPAKLYANEGACQFIFLRAASACETSYADRKGKYQGQMGVTPPRMMK
jgi:dCTP deaminase